jgi:hypothetical protein
MAKTIDLRTYLLLERAFVRRLQRSWQQKSAPLYAKIAQACNDHKWDEARRLVPDLDMAEVGTENREWITYMLLSCAVFGASTVSRHKPSFVGVGTFDTFLKQVTNNMLQYLEFGATSRIQAEALQLIAEDEAKTKAVKWDEHKHPRDKQGQFTESARAMIDLQVRGDSIEGGGPERAKWVALNKVAMDADEVFYDAKKIYYGVIHSLEEKWGGDWADTHTTDPDYVESLKIFKEARAKADEAQAALKAQAPAMQKEVIGNLAHEVAKRMGVDPHIIDVVHEAPREFDVGNKHFTEAAHYNPETGRVQLNAANISYAAPEVKGIVAHELSHHIYHSLKNASEVEFQRYLSLATAVDGQSYTSWYRERFAMAGTVRREMRLKPEYREEFARLFPASMAFAALGGGDPFKGIAKEMVQENGHSEYAKSYWLKEAVAQRGSYESAINETIAEVTRWFESPSSWHAPDHPPSPTSPWVTLTKSMHQWYREEQERLRVAQTQLAEEQNQTLRELEKRWAEEART